MAATEDATFLLADLAGFTALTEAHGDEAAAELATSFAGAVDVAAGKVAARRIKAIGDAVLLRIPDAADAIRLGLLLAGSLLEDHGAPSVRVGMHTGPAVSRGEDWFGATVNVAARVGGAAMGGETLLTETTRKAAGSLPAVSFEARGRQAFKNVRDPVALFAALGTGADRAERVVDPVCRMAVDPDRAAARLVHGGQRYLFCSLECVAEFAQRPDDYARPR